MKPMQAEKLYLPALVIVGVIFILLIFIGISTIHNLKSNRQNAINVIYQQGTGIIRAIETGVRFADLLSEANKPLFNRLLNEIGQDPDVAYICTVDSQGRLDFHMGIPLKDPRSHWHPEIIHGNEILGNLDLDSGPVPIYRVAKLLQGSPPDDAGKMDPTEEPNENITGTILIIGLRMTAFETARKADLIHAVIMIGILVVLAGGVIFFIFVIRRYSRVNQILLATQHYTQQVVSCMANGLISVDAAGKVVSHNQLALELLGTDAESIEQKPVGEVLHMNSPEIFETLRDFGSVMEKEVVHVQPNGQPVPMALSIKPICEPGKGCTGSVITIRDLREIKKLEAKVHRTQRLAAIGRLAAAVAHEIRNPLSSIRGFAQLFVYNSEIPDKVREYAAIMVREVDRINQVVTDLLTFAKPMAPKLLPTDVAQLIDHTLQLGQPDAMARKIRIHKTIPKPIPPVHMDVNQMIQVLLNLLLNAVHASSEGSEIDIGAEMDPSGKFLEIWVTDQGEGIDPEDQEKIFDPFFTTKEKGSGLGLAIVRKLVENHDGRIQVQSPVPGYSCGTRFQIRIPVDGPDRSEEAR